MADVLTCAWPTPQHSCWETGKPPLQAEQFIPRLFLFMAVTWELGHGTGRENQLYSGGHPMGTLCGLEPARVGVEEAEKQGRGVKPLTFSWFKGVSRQKGGE